jgi:hypothetical protein
VALGVLGLSALFGDAMWALALLASPPVGIALLSVFAFVGLAMDGIIALLTDDSWAAVLEGNLAQALSQEFGKRFDGKSRDSYSISRTHGRISRLSKDVGQAMAILARAHPAEGLPREWWGGIRSNLQAPATP